MSGPEPAAEWHPVVAIVQARMSSTRLPGKVMMEINGRPVLAHVVERLGGADRIDRIVIATSTDPSDDIIEQWANTNGVGVYRGSLEDVLDRYYNAAVEAGAKTVVRITADCPLIDPRIVDSVIERLETGAHEYASLGGEFPDGLDCEAFTISALKKAHKEAKLASEHEHVTPYIWKHPDRFDLSTVTVEGASAQMRWTVDDERDFLFVTKVFEAFVAFSDKNELFYMDDIIAFLADKPELESINSGTVRNEGYAKSLSEDYNIENEPEK